MALLQGSESSAIVLHEWERVLVFNLKFAHRDRVVKPHQRWRGGLGEVAVGGGRLGFWPSPGGLWVAVWVYCLSAVIFIKLWGQMQSDAMALLWKGGVLSTLGRESRLPVE